MTDAATAGLEKRLRERDAFKAWARLPILNLNLETYPAMKGQIGGGKTYRDPTTEIARAAWFAGIEYAQSQAADALAKARVALESFVHHRMNMTLVCHECQRWTNHEPNCPIGAALGAMNG